MNTTAKTYSPDISHSSKLTPAKKLRKFAQKRDLYWCMFLLIFMAVLGIFGRFYWDDRYYVPEEGAGYYLGIAGGIMMLIALCYGLFKHNKHLRAMGKSSFWLRIHIFFGIVGPCFVLMHSGFQIGSLNGGIALITMLLVYISGVFGRYLYSKVHIGLGGKKASAAKLHQALVASYPDGVQSQTLNQFSSRLMHGPNGFLISLLRVTTYSWRQFFLRQKLNKEFQQIIQDKHQRTQIMSDLTAYLGLLRKVAFFQFYEKVFLFWRHAHVPLLYLMLMSGIVHVIAVHLY